jgi:hypothetical protein
MQEDLVKRGLQGLDIKWKLNRITGVDEKAGRWRGDFEMLIGWEVQVNGLYSPGHLRKRSLTKVSHATSDLTDGSTYHWSPILRQEEENIFAEIELFITSERSSNSQPSFISFPEFKEQYHLLHEFLLAEVSFYDVEGPCLLFSESHDVKEKGLAAIGERFIQITKAKDNPGSLLIWHHARYVCEIEAEFDFREFPFDYQKFTIHGRMGQTRGYEFRRIDRSSLRPNFLCWHDFYYYDTNDNLKGKNQGNTNLAQIPDFKYPYKTFECLREETIRQRLRLKGGLRHMQTGWALVRASEFEPLSPVVLLLEALFPSVTPLVRSLRIWKPFFVRPTHSIKHENSWTAALTTYQNILVTNSFANLGGRAVGSTKNSVPSVLKGAASHQAPSSRFVWLPREKLNITSGPSSSRSS